MPAASTAASPTACRSSCAWPCGRRRRSRASSRRSTWPQWRRRRCASTAGTTRASPRGRSRSWRPRSPAACSTPCLTPPPRSEKGVPYGRKQDPGPAGPRYGRTGNHEHRTDYPAGNRPGSGRHGSTEGPRGPGNSRPRAEGRAWRTLASRALARHRGRAGGRGAAGGLRLRRVPYR